MSSCLLGESVRYDGDHQHAPLVTQILSQHFRFRSFCPEMSIGLGVPRPPIQLVSTQTGIRCKGVAPPHDDVTDALVLAASQPWIQEISGFIVKARSPSCGDGTTKIHHATHISTDGTGIFTQQLRSLFPALPIIDENRLKDTATREVFIQQVLQYATS